MATSNFSAEERFNKTDAGRQEIQARALGLSRTARNLLLIIDDTRTGLEWVGMVRGAALNDLQDLAQAQLVEPRRDGQPAGAPAAIAPSSDPGVSTGDSSQWESTVAGVDPDPAASSALFQHLYAGLNELVREELGVFKGYRVSLDVERAGDLESLRQVAMRFIEEVRRTNGEEAARKARRRLGL